MDLLTIVVPVYNVEPYLAKTLHSLCNQTYTNLEILLIDDGSSDGSLAICREWEAQDSRIRVYTQENFGVSVTRNRGIALAKGKYLMFMDGDDWIEPEMLETLHGLAVQHHADVANCILQEEAPEEAAVRFAQQYPENTVEKEPCDDAVILRETVASETLVEAKITFAEERVESGLALLAVWGPVCKLYRTDLIRDISFENYQVAEDLLFNTNVILAEGFARVATIYYPFYHYVIYPGSAMKQQFQQKYLDAMTIEEICYNKLTAISPKFGDINLIGCSVSRVFEKYAQLSKDDRKKYRRDFVYCKKFAKVHKRALLGTTDRHRKISGMLKVYVPDLYLWTLARRYSR